jgi:hypothetical protein
MCEQDVANAHPEAAGVIQVLVDVALGVDDRGRPTLLVRHEVGRVGEAAEVVLLEDHVSPRRIPPGLSAPERRRPARVP